MALCPADIFLVRWPDPSWDSHHQLQHKDFRFEMPFGTFLGLGAGICVFSANAPGLVFAVLLNAIPAYFFATSRFHSLSW